MVRGEQGVPHADLASGLVEVWQPATKPSEEKTCTLTKAAFHPEKFSAHYNQKRADHSCDGAKQVWSRGC